MKRLILALAACISMLTLFAVPAQGASMHLAVDVVSPICNQPDVKALPNDKRPVPCQDNQTNTSASNNPIFGPNGLVTKGVQLLTLVAGIIVVIVIMISGVRFMTSSGDPNSVTQARNGLLYGIIGLAIVASAQLIVTFVLSKLS